jgi:hypothetical protein
VISSIPPSFSIHEQGQEPIDGVKVYQWDNSYQCEIHGYYLNDSTTPCAEILSVIGAPQQEIPLPWVDFTITISGSGKTVDEAWVDAVAGFTFNPGETPSPDEYTELGTDDHA